MTKTQIGPGLTGSVEWTSYTDELGFTKVLSDDATEREAEIAEAQQRAADAGEKRRAARGRRGSAATTARKKNARTAQAAKGIARIQAERRCTRQEAALKYLTQRATELERAEERDMNRTLGKEDQQIRDFSALHADEQRELANKYLRRIDDYRRRSLP